MPLNAGFGLVAPVKVGAAVALALALAPSSAAAQAAQRGVVIARTYCVNCHSIDKASPSPLTAAPPFRSLHKKYPVENLEEALAQGIVTGHPSMPQFRFETDQIRDFIAFLKTLE